MRFGTQDGRFVLLADGRVLDVHAASGRDLPWEPVAALGRWDDVRAFAASADWAMGGPLDESRLGPPVPCPRQVFAVALNYRPHAAEAGFVPPEAPLVFTKFPTCIAGPVAMVELPRGKVDWEIEVVAVIGRGGYRLSQARSWDTVAGITCGQDLSERALQLTGTPAQFSLGKSFPGFGPTGPVAVTPDESRSGVISVAWHDGGPLFPHPIELHQHNDVIAGMHERLVALRAGSHASRPAPEPARTFRGVS
jgi:2-keto-4-pentenoate hydratase/2-oxohepta-3-ene-1,7-dioic acid hydratase in catechol pathway